MVRLALGAEVRGPHMDILAAVEGADLEVDSYLGVVAEDVGAVGGGAQPGAEDRGDGAVFVGSPGEVLAGSPAFDREVAGGLHPVGEFAATGGVAEAVAGEH